MEIIVGSRASGKTYCLIQEAIGHGKGAVILVPDQQQRQYVMEIVMVELLQRNVQYDEAKRRARAMVITSFGTTKERLHTNGMLFIDNLEQALINLLRTTPYIVTSDALVRTPQGKHLSAEVDNPHLKDKPEIYNPRNEGCAE